MDGMNNRSLRLSMIEKPSWSGCCATSRPQIAYRFGQTSWPSS